jgi:hypothetical protein
MDQAQISDMYVARLFVILYIYALSYHYNDSEMIQPLVEDRKFGYQLQRKVWMEPRPHELQYLLRVWYSSLLAHQHASLLL